MPVSRIVSPVSVERATTPTLAGLRQARAQQVAIRRWLARPIDTARPRPAREGAGRAWKPAAMTRTSRAGRTRRNRVRRRPVGCPLDAPTPGCRPRHLCRRPCCRLGRTDVGAAEQPRRGGCSRRCALRRPAPAKAGRGRRVGGRLCGLGGDRGDQRAGSRAPTSWGPRRLRRDGVPGEPAG